MEPEIAGAANHGSGASSEPAPSNRRWTVRRKAAIVEAVRSGQVSLDAICQAYKLSIEEFLAWERDMDRYGVPGLRATRYQIYRQTDTRSGRLKMAPRHKLTEQLALSMLARDGIAAIWQLHLSAADAHRTGHPKAAQSILELAEAAEEAWVRAEGARSLICCSKSS